MAGILIVDQIQNSSNVALINVGALAANTVGTAQIQAGSIGTAQIQAGSINSTLISSVANTSIVGTIIATQGGTGLTSPGTTGNVLTSNGSTWISSALPAGGVTSAVAGNGVAVSGATGAVTFSAVCPTFNTVGSYCFGGAVNSVTGLNLTAGSNYSAGGGNGQSQGFATVSENATFYNGSNNNLSGTWKWMGATYTTLSGYGGTSIGGLMCRVS